MIQVWVKVECDKIKSNVKSEEEECEKGRRERRGRRGRRGEENERYWR